MEYQGNIGFLYICMYICVYMCIWYAYSYLPRAKNPLQAFVGYYEPTATRATIRQMHLPVCWNERDTACIYGRKCMDKMPA